MRTRIDQFFISRSISHFVIDTSIKVFAHSDHDCVTLTLDFDCVRRGPGFWHLTMTCFPMFFFKLILSISGLSGKTRYIFSTILWFGGIGLSSILRQLRLNVRRLGPNYGVTRARKIGA